MKSLYQINDTTDLGMPFSLFYDTGKTIVPSHWHKEIEVFYNVCGDIKIIVNGISKTVRAGEIVFFASGDVHSYEFSDNHTRLVLMFDSSIIDNEAIVTEHINNRLSTLARHSKDWGEQTQSQACEFIRDIEHMKDSQIFARNLMLKSKLFAFIVFLCNNIHCSEHNNIYFGATVFQKKMLKKTREILSYIEENYHKRLTVAEIAQALNYSTGYFSRFFHRLMGATVLEYLNIYRVGQAQHMLVNEDLSVSKISELCGFGSVKTFNRIFKEITGVSPSEYKKLAFSVFF